MLGRCLKGIPSGYLTVCHGIDGPFIDGLPMKNGWIFHGKLLNNQRVLFLDTESKGFKGR